MQIRRELLEQLAGIQECNTTGAFCTGHGYGLPCPVGKLQGILSSQDESGLESPAPVAQEDRRLHALNLAINFRGKAITFAEGYTGKADEVCAQTARAFLAFLSE